MVAIEGVLNDSLSFCISELFDPAFRHCFFDLHIISVPDSVRPIPQKWVEDVEVALDEGFGAEDGDVLGQGLTVGWSQEEGKSRLQAALSRLELRKDLVANQNLNFLGKNDLNHEKRRVKQELKRYDTEFKKQFNRLPSHAEKEPMRPLYVYYRRLKLMIAKQDRAGGGSAGQSDDDMPSDKGKRSHDGEMGPRSPTQRITTTEDQINVLEARVETLQTEMDTVRTKLRLFQERFVQENSRKIKWHKDILPIEREYRMYKSFKDELLKVESQLQSLRASA